MMFVSLGIGTVIAVALIVIVSVLTGGKVTSGTAPKNALIGKTMRTFTLEGLNGGSLSAPWAKGHSSVIIIFASWCGPCQGEMPKVARYLRAHVEGPVTVMGVDAIDERAAARAFVRKDDVTFPIAFDPNGSVTSGVFGFTTVPETVFLNAKGTVTDVYLGAIPVSRLASGIASLKGSA